MRLPFLNSRVSAALPFVLQLLSGNIQLEDFVCSFTKSQKEGDERALRKSTTSGWPPD